VGSQCWDLHPVQRRTGAQLGITGSAPGHERRRRAILAKLARRRLSAGLVAYIDGGRSVSSRSVRASRGGGLEGDPPVDGDAWVIRASPCAAGIAREWVR
jgi:hypothetical protein